MAESAALRAVGALAGLLLWHGGISQAAVPPGAAPADTLRAVSDTLSDTDSASGSQAAADSAALPAATPAADTLARVARDTARALPSRPRHVRAPYPGAPLLLQAPLVDWPYGRKGRKGGFDSPSMRQSLLWSVGATQLANQSIGWAWEGVKQPFWSAFGAWASLGVFEYFFFYLPPGDGWMHEEWHRAVMTHRGVSSYDGIYHWDIGEQAISVDHVADRDLVALKDGHPADFVRLQSAGMEGEIESIRLMRRNNFFLDRSSEYDRLHWWVAGANVTAYLYTCGVDDDDDLLRKMDSRETVESRRDFTGLDFRAWAYDLRRPDEAYSESPRGRPRADGSPGYDRYLKFGDLNASDVEYLHAQTWLSLLNFVSPQLWGRDWLPGTDPWKRDRFLWNFALVHELAPFGYELAADFLVRRGKWSWACMVQAFSNAGLVLPGLGGELFRYPLDLGRRPLYLSCGASAWLQPRHLGFRATEALPGGSLLVSAALPVIGGWELWAEGDAKTQGWVAGNVNLDPALQARAGLQLRL